VAYSDLVTQFVLLIIYVTFLSYKLKPENHEFNNFIKTIDFRWVTEWIGSIGIWMGLESFTSDGYAPSFQSWWKMKNSSLQFLSFISENKTWQTRGSYFS